jgi:hypothetical protein
MFLVFCVALICMPFSCFEVSCSVLEWPVKPFWQSDIIDQWAITKESFLFHS